jgi:SNF2 family DNA or RNA helicase
MVITLPGGIVIDTDRMKLKPWDHQLKGVEVLCRRPIFGLFWDMRLGKTKAIIDAACFLFEANKVDVCLIVSPAQVKDVWLDSEMGEIHKHTFVEYIPREFCKKTEDYNDYNQSGRSRLWFVVASAEFLRQEDQHGDFPKVDMLLKQLKGKRVWLVVDEASMIGNHASLTTKAIEQLRQGLALRVTELDGTPEGNSDMDLYSKFHVLDPGILGYKNFWHYRASHGIMGGFKKKQIIGSKNMEKVTRLTRPHCWRLEQGDVLDMPEKVPSFFTVALSEQNWKTYCSLRDDLIAEFDDTTLVVNNAAAKVMRLAQVCAGFLGGFEDEETGLVETREIGEESTAGLLLWLKEKFRQKPTYKAVIWCRFRPEIERLHRRLRAAFPKITLGLKYGGAEENIKLFHQDSNLKGPGLLVGQPQAARFGYNFAKAEDAIYLSQDYNHVTRRQSEDRVQATGVRKITLLMDVLVTGPQGQKTVTWDIRKTLQDQENVGRRTAAQWKMVLQDGMRLNG